MEKLKILLKEKNNELLCARSTNGYIIDQLNKAQEQIEELKILAGLKRSKIEEVFGEDNRNYYMEHINELDGVIHKRNLLIRRLTESPDHPDTVALLAEVRSSPYSDDPQACCGNPLLVLLAKALLFEFIYMKVLSIASWSQKLIHDSVFLHFYLMYRRSGSHFVWCSTSRIADSGIHRYGTRRNQQRAMEGLQAELRNPTTTQPETVIDPPVGEVNGPSGPGPIPIPRANPDQQPIHDDQEDQFTLMQEDFGMGHVMDRMFRRLEERPKAVEGQNPLGVDVADLGLVPGVRVPPKFRVPVFEKYNGNSCPKIHVQAYLRKMVAYSDDEKLLIDLAKAFVKQYQYNADMAPDRTQLQNLSLKSNECFREYAQRWRETASRVQPPMLEKEMANMFMNTLPGPYLERLVGCNASNFADVVSTGERVENYLKTCKIQNGGGSSSRVKKSFIGGQKRREGDANSLSSYQGRGIRRNNFQNYHPQPYVAVVTIPAAAPVQQQQPQRQQNQYQQQQQGNKPAYQQRQKAMDRSFDTLPMSLPVGYDANARCNFHSGAPGHNIEICKAFKHVVQDLIDLKAINFAPTPNVVNNPMPQHGGANVNMLEGEAKSIKDVLKLKTPLLEIKNCLLKADVFPGCGKGCLDCATKSGGCLKLQQGIQALLDNGILQDEDLSVQESVEGVAEEVFEDAVEEFPNVVPDDVVIPDDVFNFSNVVADIPNIMVDSDVPIELDSDISNACFSMNEISEYDCDVATITIFYPFAHISVPEAQPVRPSTMTITTPGPLPFTSERVIPWHYGGSVYTHDHGVEQPLKAEEAQNQKSESEVEVIDPAVDNVGGIGRFTRSGRLFSPPVTQTDNADVAAKAKGKQAVNEGTSAPQVGSEPTFTKDVDELLRIIKKSDYKVVDQLIQTSSKISILSLPLCSEARREALLKVLNAAYVPQKISVNQLEGIIANVHASNGLGFTDSDLTPAGRNHNKAMHISMECKDTMLSHVLVDTDSSLNVLPKRALSRLEVEGLVLKPSDFVVRAFDGSKRLVFGEVELPIQIGSQTFNTVFYVMDISPSYSCLLGHPWIHNVGAVSSTLHQKIKFPVNGRIITVCGEEDILVSNLSTFKYVEVEGEIHETLFQAFEAVQIKDAAPVEEVEAGASISSFKQAQALVDSGVAPGWGRLLELPMKEDKFGIGYQPTLTSTASAPQTRQGPITFSSAGIIQYGRISAIKEEDGDSDCDIDNWVRLRVPGEVINNWSSEEIIQVTLLEECTSPDPIDNDSAMARFDFENLIFQAEEEGDEDCELPEELARLLKQEERVIQPHQEPTEVINLGTEDVKREIKIGASSEDDVKKGLIELLQEYVDVFAWSYQDMPGLDTDIVVHRLPLKEDCPPVKQKLRRTRPEMAVKIKEEVQKQLDAGFLACTSYPPWVANIVPVPKKDGKVRMCVDYRDLNRVSPKDDFPLPHINILVDNTAQFSVFSFMDGFSGYNQIKMAPEDMEKTTFITPWGTFCYKVMLFGLKNAGATYQ
ncbi:hypothetical protein KIW84_035096 [Lathyrus oleraceus]|uniref:Reverse transcriptase domain-containing protein n=1 Tax=Pisum sativum TaxID=3888 RepID=A0A9D4Y2V9_PEA|nr:hypothetical protein KIW84_035096 [Pisum sativum]